MPNPNDEYASSRESNNPFTGITELTLKPVSISVFQGIDTQFSQEGEKSRHNLFLDIFSQRRRLRRQAPEEPICGQLACLAYKDRGVNLLSNPIQIAQRLYIFSGLSTQILTVYDLTTLRHRHSLCSWPPCALSKTDFHNNRPSFTNSSLTPQHGKVAIHILLKAPIILPSACSFGPSPRHAKCAPPPGLST